MPPIALRRKLGNRTGYVACVLGLLCLGAVLCFRYPELLTTPELRAVYDVDLLRRILQASIYLTIGLGVASAGLSRRRLEGRIGLMLALLSLALGGAGVEVTTPIAPGPYLGLDWLVLDFFAVSLVFVPLERLFVRVKAQKVFRDGWVTDLLHYGVSHLLIGVVVWLMTAPSILFSRFVALEATAGSIGSLPLSLQVLGAMVVADMTQYTVHRCFHAFPALWRFHAVHHSSRQLDWLAGSRLHLVDIVVTRGVTLLPLSVLGFSEAALQIYAIFVAIHAVFIHTNTRFELRWLEPFLVTPPYHHWHHSEDISARDTNFAVTLPWIDRLFGTQHSSESVWPTSYGIADDPVPDGYLDQLAWPFRGER